MKFKPVVIEKDLKEEQKKFKPMVIEKYVDDGIYDYTPINMRSIVDMATSNAIRNAPDIAMAAATATGTAVAVGGILSTAGVGTPAAIASGTAAASFVASKVVPAGLVGIEFVKAALNAWTMDTAEFNLNKSTKESAVESGTEFSKGMREAVTLGMASSKSEPTNMRMVGNTVGSIMRDFLVVAGMPLPFKQTLTDKLGKDAVNTLMFNAATTVNQSVESYNMNRNNGRTHEDAIDIAKANFVGEGIGSNVGFILLPGMINKLANRFLGHGYSLLNPGVGGVSFGGYDTVKKLAAGMTIDAIESREGREITNDYEVTVGDAMSSVLAGTVFSAGMLGSGKLLGVLAKQASRPFVSVAGKIMRPNYEKDLAVRLSAKIKADAFKTTYNGKFRTDSIEKDMTKDAADTIIAKIRKRLTDDKNPDKISIITEEFEKMPGEYINEKNILSVLEVFNNVH